MQPIGVSNMRDPLQAQLREWIRSAIETLLPEELDAVLQATRYARAIEGTRHGYRHASRDRQTSTHIGASVPLCLCVVVDRASGACLHVKFA